jgi:membrane-associated phospholipid phosphatase
MSDFFLKLIHAGRAVWFGAALCLLLAAAALPFDHAVSAWVRNANGGHVNEAVRFVGGLGHGLTLSVAFVVLLVLYGEVRVGVGGLTGIFWAGMAADLLRLVTDRRRPDGDAHSFPSAHTACAFAAAVVLSRRWPRLRPAFYLGAAGVGAARVLWLRHFPSDVLAGAAVGMVIGLAAAVLAEGWRLLDSPRAVRTLKIVLSVLAVASLVLIRNKPEPIATLALPALLLLVVHRASVLMEPRLSHDG